MQVKWWVLPIIFLAGLFLGGLGVYLHDTAAGSAAEKRLTADKRALYNSLDSAAHALAASGREIDGAQQANTALAAANHRLADSFAELKRSDADRFRLQAEAIARLSGQAGGIGESAGSIAELARGAQDDVRRSISSLAGSPGEGAVGNR